MSNTYQQGDSVRVYTSTPFQDTSEVAFDPDVIYVRYKTPAGVMTEWVYGVDGEVSKNATGDYEADIDTDVVGANGTWYYEIMGESSAGVSQGAAQGEFIVKGSKARYP